MKTAIQELIDKSKESIFMFSNIILLINELNSLEKEKEQIMKAHIDGFDHIVVDFKKQEYAEQYYNETYNQNKS